MKGCEETRTDESGRKMTDSFLFGHLERVYCELKETVGSVRFRKIIKIFSLHYGTQLGFCNGVSILTEQEIDECA